MSNAISINGLTKQYGKKVVLDNLSFSVEKGEIFGLLGANGAGKTTTLECIEGLRKYDVGKIDVFGSVGVQLQSSTLPENITAWEAFKLFCLWNNIEEDDSLFNRFFSLDLKGKQYGKMSTGQKRRLHLILALITDPEIIFLDEPTAGLDVEGRVSLHSELLKLKKQGKTIVIASHDMAEIESLCDHIVILKSSKIVFDGTPSELTSNFLNDINIYIKAEEQISDFSIKKSKYQGFSKNYHVFKTTTLDDALLEILKIFKEKKNKIADIRIEHETLEKRFIEIASQEEN
ncbi:ABC transporter ATP-binding protein [Mycoplasmatota bacterium]|nr:ABC transporter ATP-binding protein [Mycoplasmatota bacterium]